MHCFNLLFPFQFVINRYTFIFLLFLQPRPHEAGGKYGKGIVVRKYRKDSTINLKVELTANHKGYFEFRLCPNNAPHKVATQECLDLYLLKLAKKPSGETYGDEPAMAHDHKFYPGPGSKIFETRYRLPKDLTCSQCVLQWRYIAGRIPHFSRRIFLQMTNVTKFQVIIGALVQTVPAKLVVVLKRNLEPALTSR